MEVPDHWKCNRKTALPVFLELVVPMPAGVNNFSVEVESAQRATAKKYGKAQGNHDAICWH